MEYLRLGIIALASVVLMSKANAVVINSYTAYYQDGSSLYLDFKGKEFDFGIHYLPAFEFEEAGIYEGFTAILTTQFATLPIGGFDPIFNGFTFWVDIYDQAIMTQFNYIGVVPDVAATNTGWFTDAAFAELHAGEVTDKYSSPFIGGSFSYGDSPVQVSEPPIVAILILSMFAVIRSARRTHQATPTV